MTRTGGDEEDEDEDDEEGERWISPTYNHTLFQGRTKKVLFPTRHSF